MVEGCSILNHGCPWLGWGDIVGMCVGCHMQPESPAAGSHGKTQSVGPKGGAEGWCIIDGTGRWLGRWWCAPDCTREDGFVHAPCVATHGIHTGGSALMMFIRAGTRHAGVVFLHVAAVRVAIMPVFKTLDGVCVCVCLTSSREGLPSDVMPSTGRIHPPQRLRCHTPSRHCTSASPWGDIS